MKKNKKAQFFDFLYIAYILFLVAVIGIISNKVITESKDQFNESGIMDESNVQLIEDYRVRQVPMVDQLFMIAMIGMCLVSVVSAFFVNSAPWFYFLSAIILGIFTWINAIWANVYQQFAQMPDLISYADQFVYIPLIMRWFPLVMLVISIIIAIVMSAKR